MLNRMFLFAICCVFAIGCTTMQKTTVGGTAAGAGLGAILGHQSGHTTEGALIGAALGGVTGAAVGNNMEKTKYCPVCGRRFKADTLYCPYDGELLKEVQK
ncbi:MAG: glycine zipper domain-containing protein [Candidatus Omnitrophica bacterium]|nr:glycine zipper domain-containing protein [Candidatus Omnitrophota bacterium]MDD5441247.1 glycine zipper domain-containing protein [Candidatus Omnitrophota bacterium]